MPLKSERRTCNECGGLGQLWSPMDYDPNRLEPRNCHMCNGSGFLPSTQIYSGKYPSFPEVVYMPPAASD